MLTESQKEDIAMYQSWLRIPGGVFDKEVFSTLSGRNATTYAFDSCMDFSGMDKRTILAILSDWYGRWSEDRYTEFLDIIISTNPHARAELAKRVDRVGIVSISAYAKDSEEEDRLFEIYRERTKDDFHPVKSFLQ